VRKVIAPGDPTVPESTAQEMGRTQFEGALFSQAILMQRPATQQARAQQHLGSGIASSYQADFSLAALQSRKAQAESMRRAASAPAGVSAEGLEDDRGRPPRLEPGGSRPNHTRLSYGFSREADSSMPTRLLRGSTRL